MTSSITPALSNLSVTRKFESYDKRGSSNSNGKASQMLAQGCCTTASTLEAAAKIKLLQPSCRLHQNIAKYVENSSEGRSMKVTNIYRIQRKSDPVAFKQRFRMLLWHGTSPAAVTGIIQTGFRAGTGGLYGGGIYFADRIAKSAGYASCGSGGKYYYVLAEVAPGKAYKARYTHSEYSSPPKGYDSVKGMGKRIPKWKENVDYYGAVLPCGETVDNQRHASYELTFNEYIVYDPNRVVVRFVVELT